MIAGRTEDRLYKVSKCSDLYTSRGPGSVQHRLLSRRTKTAIDIDTVRDRQHMDF
jgi:hypothetical protein